MERNAGSFVARIDSCAGHRAAGAIRDRTHDGARAGLHLHIRHADRVNQEQDAGNPDRGPPENFGFGTIRLTPIVAPPVLRFPSPRILLRTDMRRFSTEVKPDSKAGRQQLLLMRRLVVSTISSSQWLTPAQPRDTCR